MLSIAKYPSTLVTKLFDAGFVLNETDGNFYYTATDDNLDHHSITVNRPVNKGNYVVEWYVQSGHDEADEPFLVDETIFAKTTTSATICSHIDTILAGTKENVNG